MIETEKENTNLKAALGYARHLGWAVFPVHAIIKGYCTCGDKNCSSKGKHPAVPNGFKEATIIILEGQIYFYDGKKYIKDEGKLKTYMTQLVEGIKENQRNEVIHTIRYMAVEREHAPTHYISVLNGIYDLKENKFMNHTPKLIFTNLINANYDPAATCKDIDLLFDSISENAEEIIQLLKEMVGYTLYRKNSFEKLFLLKGEGGNGKSTLLNVIGNCSGTPL